MKRSEGAVRRTYKNREPRTMTPIVMKEGAELKEYPSLEFPLLELVLLLLLSAVLLAPVVPFDSPVLVTGASVGGFRVSMSLTNM